MRIKKNDQINGNYNMKKRDVLHAKSELNQKNRNYGKKYKQQVEELNKTLDDITQAIEMLKTPKS